MNSLQEKLAEHIIQLHKDNDGLLEWAPHYWRIRNDGSFADVINEENAGLVFQQIRQHLLLENLITMTSYDSSGRSLLTTEGKDFTTFDFHRKKRSRALRLKKTIDWGKAHPYITSAILVVISSSIIWLYAIAAKKFEKDNGPKSNQPDTSQSTIPKTIPGIDLPKDHSHPNSSLYDSFTKSSKSDNSQKGH